MSSSSEPYRRINQEQFYPYNRGPRRPLTPEERQQLKEDMETVKNACCCCFYMVTLPCQIVFLPFRVIALPFTLLTTIFQNAVDNVQRRAQEEERARQYYRY